MTKKFEIGSYVNKLRCTAVRVALEKLAGDNDEMVFSESVSGDEDSIFFISAPIELSEAVINALSGKG